MPCSLATFESNPDPLLYRPLFLTDHYKTVPICYTINRHFRVGECLLCFVINETDCYRKYGASTETTTYILKIKVMNLYPDETLI
jgi:hypothetical protein